MKDKAKGEQKSCDSKCDKITGDYFEALTAATATSEHSASKKAKLCCETDTVLEVQNIGDCGKEVAVKITEQNSEPVKICHTCNRKNCNDENIQTVIAKCLDKYTSDDFEKESSRKQSYSCKMEPLARVNLLDDMKVPLELHQDLGEVHVQPVPFGIDMPDEFIVKKVSCGSRHTCVLLGKDP